MIDAKELRIGNWVIYKTDTDCGYHREYKRVTGSIIDSAASDGEIDFIEPIELTPSILEQCGFKKHDKLNRGNSNAWWKDGMNEYITHHYDGFCVYESTKPRTIKYLHELQNLVFALTGEELNFQPQTHKQKQ